MSRDDAKKILKVIVDTYPNFKLEDISSTIDAWYFFLADYDYRVISMALKTYVQTNGSGFAPSVSQLIALTNVVEDYSVLNESEAWGLVRKAISNGNYHAEDEFDKLPELVQKAVGRAANIKEWAQLQTSEVETVVSSNFMRNYRVEVQRAKEVARMPEQIQQLIADTMAKQMQHLEQKDDRRLLNG